MSTLAELREKSRDLSSLTKQAEDDSNQRKSYVDERFWKPSFDDAGNSYTEIRFLPSIPEEDSPWAKYFEYAFKGPTGSWYFEKSLTTLGENDPVAEYNSLQWNDTSGSQSDIDERQKYVKKRKRQTNYIYNILVINDTGKPENNGKVFLYRSGVQIFDMIREAMSPKFPDQKPINPFDLWKGANFKLKMYTENKFAKLDKSSFAEPSELFDGDEKKLEEVYGNVLPLAEFTDPTTFKTYAELLTKFNKVMGVNTAAGERPDREVEESEPRASENDGSPSSINEGNEPEDEEPDSDDSLDYFKKLAEDSED